MTVSLVNKTHYSCGLAVGTSTQYKNTAEAKGIKYLGFADYCTLGGALDFYYLFKDSETKCAIGVTFKIDEYKHITLYCKTQVGYTNLCRLVTLANKNSQELSLYDLYDNSEDLICLSSEIKQKPKLQDIFPDDLYFIVTPYRNDISNNIMILEQVSSDKIVISQDAYMPNIEDKILQDIMIQNSSFGSADKTFDDIRYMMDLKETLTNLVGSGLSNYVAQITQAIKNSQAIIEECSKLELKFKDQIVNYPHLLHPLNTDGCDKQTLLRRIIAHNNRWDQEDQVYIDRLEEEIDVIAHNSRADLTDYFLVTADFCQHCRDNDIPVGPGRGSGAGSLINYGLMITHLDPIKYKLLFERFISRGRVEAGTLPDIDIDFANPELVKKYLSDMYGEDRVAPIGTYQTLAIRGAIKDAFRSLYPDTEFITVNKINKLLDDKIIDGTPTEIFIENLVSNEGFINATKPYPKVVDVVSKLVGFNRQESAHPCGVAITQDPIEEFIPTREVKGKQVLGLTANPAEKSGIIKYDILGLKTLKFFQRCLQLISERYSDTKFDYPKSIYDIPLDDKKTYDTFKEGDTDSVFQFGADLTRDILKRSNSRCIEDLSIVNSVIRPGPSKNGVHESFVKRKNGAEPAIPPHPALKEQLKDTYGLMIYQESVMKCAQILGGYSLAETDNIRKAMGKKKLSILLPYKEGFIKHCLKNFPDTKDLVKNKDGKQITKAESIWDLMETFSAYGFCQAHSTSYTLIGYYCQYFKTNYPLEWWCACLTHAGDPKHTKDYYRAYKDRIMLPSINKSQHDYSIVYEDGYVQDENGDDVEGMIYMPYSAIKGVAEKASIAISENAPYTSFEDFYNRAKSNNRRVNKTVTTNMILAGAFDCWERDRSKLITEYYTLRKELKKMPEEYKQISPESEKEYVAKVLDFLSIDYIEINQPFLDKCNYQRDLEKMNHDSRVWIVGKLTGIRKRKIGKGDNAGREFALMDVTNDDEKYDIVVWPDQYEIFKYKLETNAVLVLDGKVKKDYGDKTQFTAIGIYTLKEVKEFGGLEI
ncbi:MAG: DNA polymerase III subunit alpha [Gammaproteobacteria bacterium]|nr:DNA polymerase III subunit alpha [Gammaproteobacteria bacterium]